VPAQRFLELTVLSLPLVVQLDNLLLQGGALFVQAVEFDVAQLIGSLDSLLGCPHGFDLVGELLVLVEGDPVLEL